MNKDLLFELLSSLSEPLFEKWYLEDSFSNCNQQEYYWRTFDQDEFDIEVNDLINEKNPEDPEKFKEGYYESCLKEKAEEWYDSRCSDFLSEIEDKLEFVDDSHIRIYRSIRIQQSQYDYFVAQVKNSNFLKGYDGLGVYWSFDKRKAQSHWASSETFKSPSIDLLLIAVVPLSIVDLESTFVLNMNSALGEDEAEIRLKKGEFLHLEQVNDVEIDALVVI